MNHQKVVSLDTTSLDIANRNIASLDAVNPDTMSPATVNSNSMSRDASRLESTEGLGFSEEEIQEDYLDYLITVDVFSETKTVTWIQKYGKCA